jgi:predicted nucleic acid-binding protein
MEDRITVTFDTSILVAAARSRLGASFELISSIPDPRFEICLSVALYLEWQDVLTRPEHLPPGQTAEDALGFLRFLASQARLQEVYYLWRPYLPDASDDMILELAVAANCKYIVTHNIRHFRGCEQFGIAAIAPRDFLRLVNEGANL